MKKLLILFMLLGLISCDPLRRVSTEGFTTYQEYILYKGDTVAKLTNIEYSLDNNKLVKEATYKLLDMKYGDKGKSILCFIHNTHKDWEIELDYPMEYSQFLKK